MSEVITTGTGQSLIVHNRDEMCDVLGCAIHNPTEGVHSEWPTHWRGDRGIMERLCAHGVGHPDPDGIAFIRRTKGDEIADAEAVHGCDGCCCSEGVKDAS
jgi:hypothetical protein